MYEDLVARNLVKNQIRGCSKCDLSTGTTPVPFEGCGNFLIIGQAPERGDAGSKVIRQAVGMSEVMRLDELSWMNVVSCWPDRTTLVQPKAEQVAACHDHFTRQIEAIRPRFIVAVGHLALGACLGLRVQLSDVRGNWWCTDYGYGEVWGLATWHQSGIKYESKVAGEISEDVWLWARVAKSGQTPTLNTWCLGRDYGKGRKTSTKCERVAELYISGLGYCRHHDPRVKKKPPYEQLSLLGG